jgi:hypothetical protein
VLEAAQERRLALEGGDDLHGWRLDEGKLLERDGAAAGVDGAVEPPVAVVHQELAYREVAGAARRTAPQPSQRSPSRSRWQPGQVASSRPASRMTSSSCAARASAAMQSSHEDRCASMAAASCASPWM